MRLLFSSGKFYVTWASSSKGQDWLQSKLQDSLGCMRPCLQERERWTKCLRLNSSEKTCHCSPGLVSSPLLSNLFSDVYILLHLSLFQIQVYIWNRTFQWCGWTPWNIRKVGVGCCILRIKYWMNGLCTKQLELKKMSPYIFRVQNTMLEALGSAPNNRA